MATKYTTRTATMRQSQVVDQRKIAVGKKVEIGGKYGTVVSDDKVVTKRLFVDYEGKSTDILELIARGGGGETPVVDGRIAVSDGSTTWDNVKKIIFDGATITGGEDGSVIITIVGGGEPVVVPVVDSMGILSFSTNSKYLFEGEDYTLPDGYELGQIYDKCYDTSTVSPIIQFTGSPLGFSNLTSKLQLIFTNSNGEEITTVTSPVINGNVTDGNGWKFEGKTVQGSNITFTKITYTIPTNIILGSWNLKGSVINNESTSDIENTTTDKYFAYDLTHHKPQFVNEDATFTVTPFENKLVRTGSSGIYVSGIFYPSTEKTYIGFDVTTIPFINSVPMAENKDDARGYLEVSLTNDATTVKNKNIVGTPTDNAETELTNTFTYYFDQFGDSIQTGENLFTIKQSLVNGAEIEKEVKILTQSSSDQSYEYDTYNVAKFYREDTETEDDIYGRVLGTLNCVDIWAPYLILSDDDFESDSPLVNNTTDLDNLYNHQAVVKQGSLVHPKASGHDPYKNDTDTGNKYYIRKFMINPDSGEAALNLQIKLPGFNECENESKEAWLIVYNSAEDYYQGGRIDKVVSDDNVGLASSSTIKNNIFVIDTNANVLPPRIMKNQEFYIVVILKDETASITGQIEVAEKFEKI